MTADQGPPDPAGPPRERDTEALPPPLAAALRRAHHAEATSHGPHRRPALRRTRELIGATLAIGYSLAAVADCLGITPGSVRDRQASGGSLSDAAIADLTGLDRDDIERWRREGLLPASAAGLDGEPCYPTIDVVRVLADEWRAGDRRG